MNSKSHTRTHYQSNEYSLRTRLNMEAFFWFFLAVFSYLMHDLAMRIVSWSFWPKPCAKAKAQKLIVLDGCIGGLYEYKYLFNQNETVFTLFQSQQSLYLYRHIYKHINLLRVIWQYDQTSIQTQKSTVPYFCRINLWRVISLLVKLFILKALGKLQLSEFYTQKSSADVPTRRWLLLRSPFIFLRNGGLSNPWL